MGANSFRYRAVITSGPGAFLMLRLKISENFLNASRAKFYIWHSWMGAQSQVRECRIVVFVKNRENC